MKCKQCGKEFTPINKQQLYCCARCRNRYQSKVAYLKKTKLKKVYVKFCSVCNKKFKTTRANQIYCSLKCSRTSGNARLYKNQESTLKKVRQSKINYKLEMANKYNVSYGIASLFVDNNDIDGLIEFSRRL